jgi:hypothetical protein
VKEIARDLDGGDRRTAVIEDDFDQVPPEAERHIARAKSVDPVGADSPAAGASDHPFV